jgi:hypothetical protein
MCMNAEIVLKTCKVISHDSVGYLTHPDFTPVVSVNPPNHFNGKSEFLELGFSGS